ncbi:MAG: fasciclin domain-containing protein [Actinomycetota bacterium]
MKKWTVMVVAVASMTLLAAACSSSDTSTSEGSEMPAIESMAPDQTIPEIASSNEDFSTLVAAIGAADLGETLAGEGPFTVFAPTDEAFDALPEGTLDTLLLPKNKEQLAGILTYHVVADNIMAADVESGEVTTVNGQTFTIEATAAGVNITDAQGNTANVTSTDIVASNGVIHVIDAVVLPAES